MAKEAQALYIERNAQYERKLTTEEFLFRNTVVKETYALFTNSDKDYQTMYLHGVGDKDTFAYLCIWVTMNKAKKWVSMQDFQIIASKATLFEKHEFGEAYIAGGFREFLKAKALQKLKAASKFEENAYKFFFQVMFHKNRVSLTLYNKNEREYYNRLQDYVLSECSITQYGKWINCV